MLRIDFHIHTSRSDGKMKPLTAIKYAISLGLDGIAITDHDVNVPRSFLNEVKRKYPDFILIPGIEVSSAEGHILVLGVTESIPAGIPAEEVFDRAHELGGIAVPAHPYDGFRDGMGEENLIKFLGKYDAIEAVNGGCIRELYNKKAIKFAKKHKIPMIGGSDSHILYTIGTVITLVDASSTVDDILFAVKKGKTKIVWEKASFFKVIKVAVKKFFTKTK